MSKRRPSNVKAVAGDRGDLASPIAAKRQAGRVFHATFTRKGRRRFVRAWSTKIQHQGQRKTFVLAAPTKAVAEAEARALVADIASEGWDVVVARYHRDNARSFPKTDLRYWGQRLVIRKNSFPACNDEIRPLSAAIQHLGRECYFPLGTTDPEMAAAKALAIYRTVIERGWNYVWTRYPREATLAFHWGMDPLLWCYTTVHTSIKRGNEEPAPLSVVSAAKRRVVLAEPDEGLRESVRAAIATDGHCDVGACATVKEAQDLPEAGVTLWLVNRDLAEGTNFRAEERFPTGRDANVLWYSVHSDSEALFAATPGGRSAYLLRRVTPAGIFDPIASRWEEALSSRAAFGTCVQAWFLRLVQQPPVRAENGGANLTSREQDVLNLLSKGCVDKEIAAALGISVWTVHEHLKRIFEKLQVHSRTEAVLAHLQK